MNFLAHCALAEEASNFWRVQPDQNQGLLAGAVLADFSKGAINTRWPEELRAGVRLHRRIDAVSNQHPGMRTSCQRFPTALRRFAPIFVDILGDYYLSTNWQRYAKETLSAFTPRCYRAISRYQNHLPQQSHSFIAYMSDTDLLGRYHEWATVERALLFSLKRLGKDHLGHDVVKASEAIAAEGADDFHHYYEDFRHQITSWSNLLDAK